MRALKQMEMETIPQNQKVRIKQKIKLMMPKRKKQQVIMAMKIQVMMRKVTRKTPLTTRKATRKMKMIMVKVTMMKVTMMQ